MMTEFSQILRAKNLHRNPLLSKPNVVGVGVAYKVVQGTRTEELSIVCMVSRKTSDLPKGGEIPREVDSIKTDVIQVGVLRALGYTGRQRPAPGGISIGHFAITAGTLGVVVRDRDSGQRLILSNNHVLANSNDAEIGDAILQPGPADGGQMSSDTIAVLERFVPIEYTTDTGTCGTAKFYADVGNAFAALLGSKHRLTAFYHDQAASNKVDAALARPLNDADVLDRIEEIGEVSGTAPPALGMPVRKTGRTTGFTTDEINAIDATVNVSYGLGKTAQFDGQLVAGAMSEGGDSGSLVVAGDSQQAVGLLFAGSTSTTIFSPIQDVLDELRITI
jgi:hypothetical protein